MRKRPMKALRGFFMRKFRPIVEVRVFFDRLGLVLSAVPHLWRHYGDWDWAYPVATLRWRCARLERVIRADPWHEGVEEQANDIKQFLKLLDDHENAIDRVPRTPGVDRWLGQRSLKAMFKSGCTEDEEQERTAWALEVDEFAEKSWNDAWDLFRDKARGWWV